MGHLDDAKSRNVCGEPPARAAGGMPGRSKWSKLAPTTPHPGGSNKEPFHKPAGPGVGIVDRLENMITSRATR
jgi:hypothetical protein